MTLLERLSVASQDMTLGERFFASVQVAIMGIGIVFVALFMLFLIIKILEKAVHQSEAGAKKKQEQKATQEEAAKQAAAAETETEPAAEAEEMTYGQDEQLVAVITAAVAASMETSTHSIVVRNIIRTPDVTPAWGRLGRIQQINRQLH